MKDIFIYHGHENTFPDCVRLWMDLCLMPAFGDKACLQISLPLSSVECKWPVFSVAQQQS